MQNSEISKNSKISAKSTKAEIWQAYQELLAQTQAELITAPMVRNTAAVVARESVELGRDLVRLGAWLQRQVSAIVEIYNKPVMRTR